MDEQALTRSATEPVVGQTLEEWVADHGPLWPDVALVLALEICAQTSRLAAAEVDATIGSLHLKRIRRASLGGWEWRPTRLAVSARGTTESDVIERLGALLFHALTGRPVGDALAEETAVRARLRSQRHLTPAVADLVVRALATRQSRPWPLDMFAREVRQALGPAPAVKPRARRRGLVVAAAIAAFTVALGLWWWSVQARDRVETHGLTADETVFLDITEERAQTFAQMDEHTAAIEQYLQIGRLWTTRVSPGDPRLSWNVVHEAWGRTLRGDRLTTEQLLGSASGTTPGLTGVEGTTARLAATLGNRHPYTRVARLELAATLDARGAKAEAARLRAQAETGTRELVGDPSLLLDGVPAPPGVVAHVAPNAPEHEGFRRRPDGSYVSPLTSIQRLMSSRGGWRLHVVASGACRASVVVEDPPRQVAVNASLGADKRWHVQVDGTTPVLTSVIGATETIRLTLIGDGHGGLRARVGHEEQAAALGPANAPPVAPHSLAFEGGPGSCALIWLEIPFPFAPVPAS